MSPEPSNNGKPGADTPFLRRHFLFSAGSLMALLAVGGLLYGIFHFSENRSDDPFAVDLYERTESCRKDLQNDLSVTDRSLLTFEAIADICYDQVRGEAVLQDFQMRRTSLSGQTIDGKIILWMVIVITLSGVALAAFQLYVAYQLAAGTGGALTSEQHVFDLEKGKISMKSSVTGLMILAVSLAFFIVYVAWVYTAKELRQERPDEASRPVVVGKLLEFGGLGTPDKQTDTEDESE